QLTQNAQEAGFRIDNDAAILYLSPLDTIYTAGANAVTPAGSVDTPAPFASFSTIYAKVARPSTADSPVAIIDPDTSTLTATHPSFGTLGGDLVLEAPHAAIAAQRDFTDIITIVSKKLASLLTDVYSQRFKVDDPPGAGSNAAQDAFGADLAQGSEQ